jgi:hypothetical protein
MDVLTWIQAVTAVATMITSALDVRKAGLDLADSRDSVMRAGEVEGRQYSIGPEEKQIATELVIDQELLAAFVQDIRATQERFTNVVNDVRYTPAQQDQELEIAMRTICIHLQRIREFNNGRLPPSGSLEQIWMSWRCESKL